MRLEWQESYPRMRVDSQAKRRHAFPQFQKLAIQVDRLAGNDRAFFHPRFTRLVLLEIVFHESICRLRGRELAHPSMCSYV